MCNKSSGESADDLAQRLVDLAQQAGSTDDITAVVIRLGK